MKELLSLKSSFSYWSWLHLPCLPLCHSYKDSETSYTTIGQKERLITNNTFLTRNYITGGYWVNPVSPNRGQTKIVHFTFTFTILHAFPLYKAYMLGFSKRKIEIEFCKILRNIWFLEINTSVVQFISFPPSPSFFKTPSPELVRFWDTRISSAMWKYCWRGFIWMVTS